MTTLQSAVGVLTVPGVIGCAAVAGLLLVFIPLGGLVIYRRRRRDVDRSQVRDCNTRKEQEWKTISGPSRVRHEGHMSVNGVMGTLEVAFTPEMEAAAKSMVDRLGIADEQSHAQPTHASTYGTLPLQPGTRMDPMTSTTHDYTEWEAHPTDDGKVFFYNTRTGESTWELPMNPG